MIHTAADRAAVAAAAAAGPMQTVASRADADRGATAEQLTIPSAWREN